MKKTLLSLLMCGCMLSCKKDTIEVVTSQKIEEKYFDLHGLEARIPDGIDPKWFKVEGEDFLNLLGKERNLKISAKDEDWSKVNYSILMSLIEKEMKKLPDLTKFKDGKEDWGRFKKDFPGIKNYAELETKGDIVSNYYSVIVRQKISPEVVKMLEGKSSFRPSSIEEFSESSPLESLIATAYPVAGWSVNVARNYMENLTRSKYDALNSDHNNLNAAKHASWNAIGIQEMMQRLMSLNASCARMRDFASAHEVVSTCTSCPESYNASNKSINLYAKWYITLFKPIDIIKITYNFDESGGLNTPAHFAAMDLHNNLMGRTYMKKNAGFFSRPSDKTITEYFYKLSCSSTVTGTLDIYNKYSGTTLRDKFNSLQETESLSAVGGLVHISGNKTIDIDGNDICK